MLCCDQVAVFGLGNAAFETANALAPVVDYVHVFPGRKAASLPLVSWETRYPVRTDTVSFSVCFGCGLSFWIH